MCNSRRNFFYVYQENIMGWRGNLEHWLGYVISLKLFLEVVMKRKSKS